MARWANSWRQGSLAPCAGSERGAQTESKQAACRRGDGQAAWATAVEGDSTIVGRAM